MPLANEKDRVPEGRTAADNGVLVAIAYVLTGKLALLLAIPPGYSSAIFPPAGLAIAAIYLWGQRVVVWIFLGSALLNLWVGTGASGTLSGTGVAAAILIAVASAIQGSMGGWALRRLIGYPSALDQARDLLAFMLLTPLLCLVSSTISVGGLYALGLVGQGNLAANWLKWWIGDTLGVTVIFPVLLIFFAEPRSLWRSRRWTVALPMIGAFALSIAVFVKVSKWEQDDELSVFRASARQFATQLQDSFRDHEFLVSALAGFVAHDSTGELTGDDFQKFARNASLPFPMVQAMEWVPRIRRQQRSQFEAKIQRTYSEFEIREPDASGQLVRAADRPDYFPVTYVEPLEGNRPALGFDLASNPERNQAILRAMNEGRPVASSPIKLVQEQARQAGVLLLMRVGSGDAVPGLVLTVLRIGDVVTRAMPDDKSILEVRLIDTASQKVIFGDDPARPSAYELVKAVHLGGREFLLRISPTETYLEQHKGWQSLVLHAASLFGTSLLGAILLLGTGYTVRVEHLVDERTAALATESRKNEIFLRSTGDGLHILDTEGRLIEASDSFCRMLGYSRSELLGLPVAGWMADAREAMPGNASEYGWDVNAGAFQTQYRRKDGSLLDVEVSAYGLELDERSLLSLSARDVSERKRAEEQIRQLAFYDTLTGLPNRRLLIDRLTKALAQAGRHDRSMAVMFLDLDKFKQINDTLGHDAGDELLKEVATRLIRCVRSGDTVARQGGDEFVIILSEISDPRDAEVVAQKVVDALAEPVSLLGQIRHTSTSIGISVFPVSGTDDVQELMKKADIAMYEAKKAGRNCFRFYADDRGAPAASA